MRVRDVGEGDGHAGFLHLSDIAQRVLGQRTVESRKSALTERVGHGLTRCVVDARAAVVDGGIDIFGPEERLEAEIAARLIEQPVRTRIRHIGGIGGADPAALRAVNPNAYEISQRLRARGRPGRSGVGGERLVPLR